MIKDMEFQALGFRLSGTTIDLADQLLRCAHIQQCSFCSRWKHIDRFKGDRLCEPCAQKHQEIYGGPFDGEPASEKKSPGNSP